MDQKKILGLDIGYTSVGWALLAADQQLNPTHIIDTGVRIFPPLENTSGDSKVKVRGDDRRARRTRRRKQHRLQSLNALFRSTFRLESEKVIRTSYPSPFEIKVKGLTEELSTEELYIALYHYTKYRGFKSNRKVDLKSDTEDGKMNTKINSIKTFMDANNLSISEYIVNHMINEKKRIHNTSNVYDSKTDDGYIFTFDRATYLVEIKKLLDKQKEFHVIDDIFINTFIMIWSRQRDFSEGPGKNSIYAAKTGSFIEKNIGLCIFDGKTRAAQSSYSSEVFKLLSHLNNITYRLTGTANYVSIPTDVRMKILELAHQQKALNYGHLSKLIGCDIDFKGITISQKTFNNTITKFKQSKKLDKTATLSETDYDTVKKLAKENAIKETKLPNLSNYIMMKEVLVKNYPDHPRVLENANILNEIADILLKNKADATIIKSLEKLNYPKELIDTILLMPTNEKTSNLSPNILERLIKPLKEGLVYSEAMESIGINHSVKGEIKKRTLIPPMHKVSKELHETITNKNVENILNEAIKVINAVTQVYGTIDSFKIELAREVSKSHTERQKISNQQLDNLYSNSNARAEILRMFPNYKSIDRITRQDVIIYKLHEEQKGICIYTGETIPKNMMFSKEYEVDHILPISRSFDDSFTNKVLVTQKSNQNKGNSTPYETFQNNFEEFSNRVKTGNHKLSFHKKEKLLLKEIPEDFIDRNIIDTQYASKLMLQIIKSYLTPIDAVAVNGRITSHLRARWGLNGLVHTDANAEMQRVNNHHIHKLEIGDNHIKCDILNKASGELEKVEIKKINKKELNFKENKLNNNIDKVTNNKTHIENYLRCYDYQNTDISDLITMINKENGQAKDINHDSVIAALFDALSELNTQYIAKTSKKNRANHLHHVVDAIVVACVNRSIIMRLTKFFQYERFQLERLESSDLEELGSHQGGSMFPIPYDLFREEVKNRVFERDIEKLFENSKNGKTSVLYKKENELFWNNLSVVNPSRSPIVRTTGSLHKQTILGETHGVITRKLQINNQTIKKIETAIEKDKVLNISGGSDVTIASIQNWLKLPKESRTTFPVHLTKKNPIKSVKIIETEDLTSRIKLGDKRYVDSDDVFRTDIYIKKGEERLYYTSLNMYDLTKEKDTNHMLTLFYGQGKNKIVETGDQLKKLGFIQRIKLTKSSLLSVEHMNGTKILAYLVGSSTGRLEFMSVVGDDFDLVGNGKFFETFSSQLFKTISQIKSIKVKHINILGKVK